MVTSLLLRARTQKELKLRLRDESPEREIVGLTPKFNSTL